MNKYIIINMKKYLKILTLILFCLCFIFNQKVSAENKIKIGLLVPNTGENKKLGEQIIKSVRMAINDIDNNKIEILIKDSGSNPDKTLQSAEELKDIGVNIVLGPVFIKSLEYLDQIEDMIFLSFTNQTINLPKNVISSGVNSTSQINTISKFIDQNKIDKTIFLIPKLNYEAELKKSIKKSKLKKIKIYSYDTEPTKLTKRIEEITNYQIRKRNLEDEIRRLKKSEEPGKEKKIANLEKRYTLGRVNFDAIIIGDFDESLKSVATSLLYSDVSPKKKYFITLNQWFNRSFIVEESLQPIYYPSIDKKNFELFKKKFFKEFDEYPDHISLLSYDLVGLVYYLSLTSNLSNIDNLFKKESSFKGKMGIFDIKNNEINHRLNFYKVENKKLIKIF